MGYSQLKNGGYKMEKCNTCQQMVKEAPFGQCDDCFNKAMEEDGSVIYDPSETKKGGKDNG